MQTWGNRISYPHLQSFKFPFFPTNSLSKNLDLTPLLSAGQPTSNRESLTIVAEVVHQYDFMDEVHWGAVHHTKRQREKIFGSV